MKTLMMMLLLAQKTYHFIYQYLFINFLQNLKNLYAILEQMTDAATRVTNLYLEEVEDR